MEHPTFKCANCDHVCTGDELVRTKTTYEQYYGVAADFPTGTPLVLCVCPKCGSDEVNGIDPWISDDVCPECGGRTTEGTMNEYGVECDTCNYPYPNEEE